MVAGNAQAQTTPPPPTTPGQPAPTAPPPTAPPVAPAPAAPAPAPVAPTTDPNAPPTTVGPTSPPVSPAPTEPPPAPAPDGTLPPAEGTLDATAAEEEELDLVVPGTESAPSKAASANPNQTVVVTGSRLEDPVGEQAPVQQVTAEDLARTGLVSVGDVLQRLPSSGGAINGKSNSSGNLGNPPDGGGVGAGAIEADLRYLGSKRVLVLVDGVRWVNGSSASGVAAATDMNTIPMGMIERIEVLEDGASPVYGSDAVAGVINIITKREFRGASANGYIAAYPAHKDGFTQKYDLTWGDSTERMAVVAGVSYLDQRQVNSGDRELSDSPIPTLDNCEAGCSSATPNGRIRFVDPAITDPEMAQKDITLTKPGTKPSYPDDYVDWAPSRGFNFAPYNLMMTPSRRISAFSSLVYHLTERTNFHGRTTFTNRQSVNQAAPEPLFIGPDAGNGVRTDTIGIDPSNPYNPFSDVGDVFNPDGSSYLITRRPVEAGPRKFEQTVNTFVLSGGFDGKFNLGKQNFSWDVTALYGVNRADQRRNNSFNSAKLQQALGPAHREDGKWKCGTAENPGDPACVPFNIFGGPGSITPEMLDYVTYTQHDISNQTLADVVGNVNGTLARLPAGPLGIGLGAEYRKLAGYFEPDSVVAAGDSADIPAQPTKGSYSVMEAYAEARIPLVAGIPGLELLDLNAAGRVSDYSFLSPELTGKVGGRWQPIEDLIFRASYGRGFRAPSIGELYGSKSRFDATLTDPCSNFNDAGVPAAVKERCIELGVPADGSYEQLNPQQAVQTGGNRKLDPEISKSLNLSLAYSFSWLTALPNVDLFDLEVAYWSIDLDKAIAAPDAQVQLDQCVRGNDDEACKAISRTATGVINGYSNSLQNIGGIETRGIDFSLKYASPNRNYGRFKVTSTSTYLLKYWEKYPTLDGVNTVKREGEISGEPEKAYPVLKSNLVLDWFFRQVGVALTTRYIHSVTEPCRGLVGFDNTCSDFKEDDSLSTNELPITVYNDVQLTWLPTFDDRLSVNVGVNNMFNIDPPTCYSCSLNGFNATTYDIPGVYGYLSAGYALK